ncbi:MAG TPA: hypothetical protein VL096_06015 [Pirellulaceae bacterium]|nr:hypothetical protein [Pirellulaceae bacterium]
MVIWNRCWQEDDGALSFEWVLLITLLVIGIVSGVSAARDAIIDELGDIAQATLSFDQSYTFPALIINGIEIFPAQDFDDDAGVYDDCDRGGPAGQGLINDGPTP